MSNHRSIIPLSLLCSCLSHTIVAYAQQPTVPLTLDKSIPMSKVEGRIDHLAVDIAGQRLFVAALGNNSVELLDLKAGSTIGAVTATTSSGIRQAIWRQTYPRG
jgi:hypothetical protein